MLSPAHARTRSVNHTRLRFELEMSACTGHVTRSEHCIHTSGGFPENMKPVWSGLHDNLNVVREASTSATRLQLVILNLENVVGLQALIQVLPTYNKRMTHTSFTAPRTRTRHVHGVNLQHEQKPLRSHDQTGPA